MSQHGQQQLHSPRAQCLRRLKLQPSTCRCSRLVAALCQVRHRPQPLAWRRSPSCSQQQRAQRQQQQQQQQHKQQQHKQQQHKQQQQKQQQLVATVGTRQQSMADLQHKPAAGAKRAECPVAEPPAVRRRTVAAKQQLGLAPAAAAPTSYACLEPSTLRLGCHNVNGLAAKLEGLLALWRALQLDVVAAVDTHVGFWDRVGLDQQLHTAGWKAFWCVAVEQNGRQRAGVAVLIRNSLLASGKLKVRGVATPGPRAWPRAGQAVAGATQVG